MEAAQRERYRAALDAISRRCAEGLAGDELFAMVSAELCSVLGFRTGGWARLDPATMLPLPGLLLQAGHDGAKKIIHNEYFEPDFVKFRDLARRRVPVQTLSQATDGQLHRSNRYRSLLATLGYGDELRAVFRCGGIVWGAACVARSVTDPPFSRADVSFMTRICEPVARALRMSHLLAGDGPAGPAPPGVLVLDSDGGIVSQTDTARHWLSQLPRDQARGLDLPATVFSAACAARTMDVGSRGGRVRTTDGRWLRLHAARLTPDSASDGQVAVILEPAGLAELSPLVLDLHGLTRREREITQLLLRGLPTADIAGTLFISRHTLSDHMKAIFAKLAVSSRPELTVLLLDHAAVRQGS